MQNGKKNANDHSAAWYHFLMLEGAAAWSNTTSDT